MGDILIKRDIVYLSHQTAATLPRLKLSSMPSRSEKCASNCKRLESETGGWATQKERYAMTINTGFEYPVSDSLDAKIAQARRYIEDNKDSMVPAFVRHYVDMLEILEETKRQRDEAVEGMNLMCSRSTPANTRRNRSAKPQALNSDRRHGLTESKKYPFSLSTSF